MKYHITKYIIFLCYYIHSRTYNYAIQNINLQQYLIYMSMDYVYSDTPEFTFALSNFSIINNKYHVFSLIYFQNILHSSHTCLIV